MANPTLTDLWDVQDAVWNTEDRQYAIEAAFNVLLVTLHESGALNADRFRIHLQGAAHQIEEKGEALRGAVAALDELIEHVGVLLPG